jgi:replicative DNA helicase
MTTLIQDQNIEAAVLGALLQAPNEQHHITELQSKFFADPVHRDIFTAMQELYSKGSAIDIVTVSRHCLQNKYLPKPVDIAGIASLIASAANLTTHSKHLYELSALRELQAMAADVQARITGGGGIDPFKIADEAQATIDAIRNNMGSEPVRYGSLLAKTVQDIGERSAKGEAQGITSGWPALDHVTSGMSPGELWIIAGRPGMGKTALAVALQQAHAMHGGAAVMFSLEMENKALAMRMLSGDTGLPAHLFRQGKINEATMRDLLSHVDAADRLKLWFEDSPGITIEKIRARVKTMKHKHGLTCVVCDYIGLVQPTNSKEIREQQIAHISRTAKSIAKECGVTFIMLAQLNRQSEQRADKRPMLSDLRESGAIEQDADLVMFPYRPAYYGQEEGSPAGPTEEAAELIIAKNRNGAANMSLPLTFIPQLASYKLRAPFQTF